MQILCSSLLRHPNVVATSPAPMNRFSYCSRALLSFMSSATLSWWPRAHARRVFPLMVLHNLPVRRLSRFPPEPWNMATRVKDNESGKPHMKNIDTRGTILELAGDERNDKDACRVTSEAVYAKPDTLGQIVKHTLFQKKNLMHTPSQKTTVKYTVCGEEDQRRATNHKGEIVASDDRKFRDHEGYKAKIVIENSSHRDGSIYRDMDTWWKKEYCIADRNETRLEAMKFSNPSNCITSHDGTCLKHYPRRMLQILSLRLAKTPVDCGSIELYGYIAARDNLDTLLNYVVNFSRGGPIVVEQGSLIYMTGPKRGIEMVDSILIEYDLRVKAGPEEKDDLQLIDGASIIGPAGTWNKPFTISIPGDNGTVEITLLRHYSAVEATVEVLISEVQHSFDLGLSCLTSGMNKGIGLFDGVIAESCSLKRSVVAVPDDSLMDLKFKIGPLASTSAQHCCSFKAKSHGHDTQEIKTDLALVSVKVTWSTLPSGLSGLG